MTPKAQTLTTKQQQEFAVRPGANEYWQTLTANNRDFFTARVLRFEFYKGAELLAMAMNAAYARSPQHQAALKEAKEAYENEMLVSTRTGNPVARKDAVVAGKNVVAISELTDAEREWLQV